MGADTPTTGAAERMLRFERSMVRIRWFGIAFGFYQVFWYEPFPNQPAPTSMVTISATALGLLALANVGIWLFLRRARTEATLRRLSAAVLLADTAALWAITWAFTFEELGATWVILLIACLEGAVRFQFPGALAPVIAAIPIETGRELYSEAVFGHTAYVTGVTFRLGMMAIIGFIAGAMARDLERERVDAELRAGHLEDLAQREAAARRESAAFQEVILAGVSADGLEEALHSMLKHVASALGYRNIVVLMIEEDGRLHPVARQGFTPAVMFESVAVGEGIAGFVALTGRGEIIADVSDDVRYYCVDATTRSQITLPITLGGDVIGVLHCESPELEAFSEADAARLERLSAQMALVIQNARLLSQERATVERLRELDVMKSDFVAIASHELRTPLTAMQGSIKTLRFRNPELSYEQAAEMLGILDRQSDRLTRLVEDLLIVSRIDAGSVSLRMAACDLHDVFADVLQEVGPRAQRVSLAVPATMPRIITDPQRLGQIIRNLVENALKFAPEATTVRVAAHHEGTGIVVEVSDDGPGIPGDQLEQIFERFHQVGGSMRRRSDGFGLGLYIARRLVEALGGSIDVRSEVGNGTTFRVRVPAAVVERGVSETA